MVTNRHRKYQNGQIWHLNFQIDNPGSIQSNISLNRNAVRCSVRYCIHLSKASDVKLLSFYDNFLLIHRLSDAGGKMEFTEVASGKDINKSLFCSDDGML